MQTIRRLIYLEVFKAVGFVTLGFLCLFFFFDFVDELGSLEKASALGYHLPQALARVALLIPSHLYELLPITVLIGTVYVMASLARSSEYTILRTSGLGPWRALRLLLVLGLGFAILTFAVGDYIAPATDRAAQILKSRAQGFLSPAGLSGGWLKEKHGTRSFSVNVVALERDATLTKPTVFEFDSRNFLIAKTSADSARIVQDGWVLQQAVRQVFETQGPEGSARISTTVWPEWEWPSTLTADMVSVALLKPDRMRAIDLFEYTRHLDANGQTAQRYEIQFWRKVFYPLSCLVMVVLALPFAYLHFRQGGIASYVFAGVMIGISFFLLNDVVGYIGNLRNWTPWLAGAAPSLIYSVLSLGAFGWLVLRR